MIARDPSRVAELVAGIRCHAPAVTQSRAQFDCDRRLSSPLFEVLADAGLMRLWLPEALGGPELSPLDFMEVVEAAAELDGSVGWIVGNGAGMSRAAGYLPADVARTWFADPRAFIASATGAIGGAVPVEGGYRVTGRWPFGSGIHHATQVMGLCSLPDAAPGAPPEMLCCYFARNDIEIIDTWRVSGLRGTGSCDFATTDLFVPAAHTHKFIDARPTQPGLIYRMPNLSVFALSVSVVPLGIARAAISTLVELLRARARAGAAKILQEREIVQAEIGRAETLHAAARALLKEAIGELMAATDAGGEQLVRTRAAFRAACSHAAESAVRVADMMAAAAGAAAIFETSPLERCVRDVHAANKHVAMSPNNYVVAGRIALGLAPGTARF